MNWKPFNPDDWRDRGSCYPCIVWDRSCDMLWTPCDPWSLPPEGDYSTWVCISVADFLAMQAVPA